MKKYDNYKDSGIEWIGEIPEHWEVKKIKFLSKLQGGYAFKSNLFSDSGIPIIRIGNINNPIDWNDCKKVPENLVIPNEFLLKKFDTLIALSGATTGKTAFVSDEPEFSYINQRVAKVGFTNKLLYFNISGDFVQKLILLTADGSAQENISNSQIENINIVLPSINKEQTAIANFLDRKTAEIDNLITKKEKLLKLYDEEKTAIINQAVTKGTPRKDGISSVSYKDSGVEWLGDIPEHWEVKKLKYLGEIVLGKMLTNSDKGNYHKRKYLRAANLEWLNVNIESVKEMWFSIDELKRLKLKENDLLVSEGGEVGRTCIWKNELDDCYIQNSVHKITLNENHNSFYFLYQFYVYGQKGLFESIVNRISIAHLTGEKIKTIDFIAPPTEEQIAIVHHIETETARINSKITKTKKLIKLLKEYKTALISEVVTGKIDVREEIPNG